jgi:hypothetical protein
MFKGLEQFCLTSAINKLIAWTSSSAPPNSDSLRGYSPGLRGLLPMSSIATYTHNSHGNAKSLINNDSRVRITAIMLNWLNIDQLKLND